MATEYAPLYMPGDVITGTASGTILAGQMLQVSGNGTVAPTTAASAAFVGVAAHDAANGTLLAYHARGQVHVSPAASAITAGAQLTTAASGKVDDLAATATAVAADINSARSVIGVALTTAAQDALVTWMEF